MQHERCAKVRSNRAYRPAATQRRTGTVRRPRHSARCGKRRRPACCKPRSCRGGFRRRCGGCLLPHRSASAARRFRRRPVRDSTFDGSMRSALCNRLPLQRTCPLSGTRRRETCARRRGLGSVPGLAHKSLSACSMNSSVLGLLCSRGHRRRTCRHERRRNPGSTSSAASNQPRADAIVSIVLGCRDASIRAAIQHIGIQRWVSYRPLE